MALQTLLCLQVANNELHVTSYIAISLQACKLASQHARNHHSRFTVFKSDEVVKSPLVSLRGAERRGNLKIYQYFKRLLRFARNDKYTILRLFTGPSKVINH
jgi:hypothetical protein